jgi:succinate dehydrogenase / fumarate reductase iron-sulfur subunit
MAETLMRVFRGDAEGGELVDYRVPVDEGMVVLDVIHYIQAKGAGDLSVRWNCKAGKCGSCSAEINGKPKLMCMTRMSDYPEGEPITVEPIRAFPIVRDLVADVSWNFEVNKSIPDFEPAEDTDWTMYQYDIDRVQEFRKCIECYLCQNVCHVLRDHEQFDGFFGPRFLVRMANLDMHPLDTRSRAEFLKDECGIGYCNITKCCTEVCPESITITDNAIIPLKERVVDEFYDPIRWLIRKFKRS